jgi:hypothetical protein
MRRTPVLVPICGGLTASFGGILLLVSDRVDGLAWLAAPIALLGVALLGIWLRSAVRRAGQDDSPASATPPLPGPWYPYAVLGIGAALCGWLIYWTKLR